MDYRQLGETDIQVSQICLGTMTWGQQNTEEEGHQQMDYALEQGVNFMDASEMYPIPPQAETQGRTEQIIGTWLKARQCRDKIILATKVAGRSPMNWLRDGGAATEQSRAQIFEAVDKSLKRIADRLYRPLSAALAGQAESNSLAECSATNILKARAIQSAKFLDALNECIKAGKIRHIGLSNETPWGSMAFLHEAKAKKSAARAIDSKCL